MASLINAITPNTMDSCSVQAIDDMTLKLINGHI
jgi:hypothetical protein